MTQRQREMHRIRQREWRRKNRKKSRAMVRKYRSTDKARAARKARRSKPKAHSRTERQKDRRAYYTRTKDAVRKGRRWTPEEEEAVFTKGMTDLAIALSLGRTLAALHKKRFKLVEDGVAPPDWEPKASQPGGVP